MTSTHVSALQSQALRLIGKITEDPALAAPILELLKAAGNDIHTLESLTATALAEVKRQLELQSPARAKALLDNFLQEFAVEEVNGTAVRFTLGSTPPLEFLKRGQALAQSVYSRHAIYPATLERWSIDPAFAAPLQNGGVVGVQGRIIESHGLTRAEQEKQGWNTVELPVLAVAHVAFLLATGKNLFHGDVMRAKEGALSNKFDGLAHYDYDDGAARNFVSASSYLTPSV